MFFDTNSLALRLRFLIRQRPGIMRGELRHSVSHSISTVEFDRSLRWLIDRGDVVHVPVYESRQADRYYPGLGRKSPTSSTSHDSSLQANEKDDHQDVQREEPTSLRPTFSQTETATLSELIDWKNANGIVFTRRQDGLTWVAQDYERLLTPAITQAIYDNQDTLSFFGDENGNGNTNVTVNVHDSAIASDYADVVVEDAGDTLDEDDDDDWSHEALSWKIDLALACGDDTIRDMLDAISNPRKRKWVKQCYLSHVLSKHDMEGLDRCREATSLMKDAPDDTEAFINWANKTAERTVNLKSEDVGDVGSVGVKADEHLAT
jgi:hypothetical protein